MSVNLTSLIRAVCSEYREPDPYTIAKLVLDRIRKPDQADALAQALPYLVRAEFRRGAPSYLPPPVAAAPTDPRSDQTESERQAPLVAAGPSRKIADAREAWRAWREQPINVDGTFKALGECTRPDLVAAAEARETAAKRTWARAEQLRALIELVDRHCVERVGDLADHLARPVIEPHDEQDSA